MRDRLIRFLDRVLGKRKLVQGFPDGGKLREYCILGFRYFMFNGMRSDEPYVIRTLVLVIGNHDFLWRIRVK